jgi:hypothetical protein
MYQSVQKQSDSACAPGNVKVGDEEGKEEHMLPFTSRAKEEIILCCLGILYGFLSVVTKFQVKGMRWGCTVMTTVHRGEER